MLAWLLMACQPPSSPGPLVWPDPVTTLTETLVLDPGLDQPLELDPALPDGLDAALAAGLGGISVGPGQPRVLRDDLAPGHPADTGPDRRSVALFLHESDAQLADAESPTRMVATDDTSVTQSAARPQELYAIHALDATLRTADALAPIDFGLATGDNADNVQGNEVRWFAAVWDGLPVRPDSGDPDAQPDPDGNDPLAPFTPVGADFPWYAAWGNHDVLVQGNFRPDPWVDVALGTVATLGTRDLSRPGGPLTHTTVADPARAIVSRADIARLLRAGPASPGPIGHGLTEDDVAADAISWVARPMPGLAVIAVDANPTSSQDDATLSAAERDDLLVPALQEATARGELIVVTSHYGLTTVAMEGGGRVGDLLEQYPNVVLVVAGHYHENRIRPWGTPGDPGAFWEILTSSTVDWPMQSRLVELVVNGDDTLSIYTTTFDFAAPAGSLAARARALAAVDLQSGWRLSDGTGTALDQNTELVQVLPQGLTVGGSAGARSLDLP